MLEASTTIAIAAMAMRKSRRSREGVILMAWSSDGGGLGRLVPDRPWIGHSGQTETGGPEAARHLAVKPDRSLRRGGELLLDLALDGAGIRRKLVVARLGEERVEPAAMLDRTQGVGRDAHPHRALQRLGLQGDVAEVRQELPLGLMVRVAHEVATQHGLAGQFATARHGFILSSLQGCGRMKRGFAWIADPT